MYLCPLYTNTFIGEQGALSLDIWLIPNVCVILGDIRCVILGDMRCVILGDIRFVALWLNVTHYVRS